MKVSVDSLLEPISAENPCGEDIGYDPQFAELETLLQGKPETQFAAAEEPDWKAVKKECLDLFNRSKDLRVALRLALGLLKMDGLTGFRDGILVMKGLIERYWEPVHPRLDPDDNNDPLERVNILASLTTPMGTYGDPFQFILRIRQAPLSDSSQFGAIRMVDLDRIASGAEAAEGAVTAAQAQGALRATPPENLSETYNAIVDCEVAVKEIDTLLTKAVGASNAVSFDSLASTLKDLQKALAPYVSASTVPADGSAPSGVSAAGGVQQTGGGGAGISGEIRSREDVTRVIDQICDFFKRTEPSSPVPLLLQRARRLVNLDFVELLNDLAPESLAQIKSIAGIRDAEA
jgi:type VI secretion system protein ImpA